MYDGVTNSTQCSESDQPSNYLQKNILLASWRGVKAEKVGEPEKNKQIKEKKMCIMDNQNPSTLALLVTEDDDLRDSWRSSSSNERVEEQARGGSKRGTPDHLGGEMDVLAAAEGGDGEKLNLGAGVMIPLRLGDLDINFLEIAAGSCSGNRQEYFISCIFLRFSTTVLMVGLSDGSF